MFRCYNIQLYPCFIKGKMQIINIVEVNVITFVSGLIKINILFQ